MPNRTAAILAAALAPLNWGSTYLVTTEFLPPNRPFTAALIRVLPAGLSLEALSAANLGGYLYLCLFGAVLAYVLWFDGIAKLPPAAVSSLGLLSSVCAFVLGWLFLGQGMDAKSLAGFALVLASIFGVQRAVGKAT